MGVNSRSDGSLPHALGILWREVYAAAVGACNMRGQVEPDSESAMLREVRDIGAAAERLAWEAVRRANGGTIPDVDLADEGARFWGGLERQSGEHRRAWLAIAETLGRGMTTEEVRAEMSISLAMAVSVLRDLNIRGFTRWYEGRYYALPITGGAS